MPQNDHFLAHVFIRSFKTASIRNDSRRDVRIGVSLTQSSLAPSSRKLNATHFLAKKITDGIDSSSEKFAVEFVDRLLPIAIHSGASDVHLQPTPTGWNLRIRIDGVLSDVCKVDGGGVSDPVARLMVMAGLPTYRSSSPMEGRIKTESAIDSGQETESALSSMRLGIFPTVHGPRAVIRILRRDTVFDSLASLRMDDAVTQQLHRLCDAKDGLILITGPAGSGKTTTLYTMLQQVASTVPRRSVLTIEDPVESTLSCISQSEIDASTGMTLASALRSAVRQDSDVLLVSEIRDPETVEAAMQASLTGHLVFSSLHATDVATTLRRLSAYDVPVSVIRSGIRAVINQRLLRCLCSNCKAGVTAAPSHDCAACNGTGYQGQRPLANCVEFQLSSGDDSIANAYTDALESGLSVGPMNSAVQRAGDQSLRNLADQWVSAGITDDAEVYRVLGS